MKPRIAMVLGDPAGIGPELVAKLLADPEARAKADVLIVADRDDIIGPGVELANARGVPAIGPFPADTIFLRAQAKEVDAIVTMYHDQGQIALKLMGFWRGVTVQGGLPIPITTPAHGTAFDIQGQGKAKVGATREAFEIACRMGLNRRAA